MVKLLHETKGAEGIFKSFAKVMDPPLWQMYLDQEDQHAQMGQQLVVEGVLKSNQPVESAELFRRAVKSFQNLGKSKALDVKVSESSLYAYHF